MGMRDLAVYLGISPRSVARLVAAGTIPTIRIGGRRLASREAIRTWQAERQPPTPSRWSAIMAGAKPLPPKASAEVARPPFLEHFPI